jgi:hypothetical protein
MARSKRPWLTRLHERAVAWHAASPGTREDLLPGEVFVRFVIVRTVTADGRDLFTRLTPNEARRLSRQLSMRADFVEDLNRKYGDGWSLDTDPDDLFAKEA